MDTAGPFAAGGSSSLKRQNIDLHHLRGFSTPPRAAGHGRNITAAASKKGGAKTGKGKKSTSSGGSGGGSGSSNGSGGGAGRADKASVTDVAAATAQAANAAAGASGEPLLILENISKSHDGDTLLFSEVAP